MTKLTAPFQYSGGKSRWNDIVQQVFGPNRKGVYAEPFAGSLALLLANPKPYSREVICDLNGFISNVWRSLQADPEAVAYYADWPTFHHDLTARHFWLLEWAAEHHYDLRHDPEFYDAQAAGYWIWGQSNWIGSGWCTGYSWETVAEPGQPGNVIPNMAAGGEDVQAARQNLPTDGIPAMPGKATGGIGTQAQRRRIPDGIPFGSNLGYSQGVQAGRIQVPGMHDKVPVNTSRGVATGRVNSPHDKRPHFGTAGSGLGVKVHRENIPTDGMPQSPGIDTPEWEGLVPYERGERLKGWFRMLAARLEKVYILDRDWKSAVTDSVLMQTPKSPKPPVYIVLDPPYLLEPGNRSSLYGSDNSADPDHAAIESMEWSIANGERYSIIYFMRASDFHIPPGWREVTKSFSGIRRKDRREHHRDSAIISPRAQMNAHFWD